MMLGDGVLQVIPILLDSTAMQSSAARLSLQRGTEMSNYEMPSNLRQVKVLLGVLNLPVFGDPILLKIGQEEGETFKNALVSAANKAPNAEASTEYLAALLTAYSPNAGNVVRLLGLTPPSPQEFLPLLKQEGRALRAALKTLSREINDQATRQYMMAVLAAMNLAPLKNNETPLHVGMNQPPAPNNVRPMPTPRQSSQHEQADQSSEDIPLPPPTSDSKVDIQSAHLYGGKAAFCFTKCTTQTGGYPTVSIDAARAVPGAERSYDWKNKVIFQLTVGELPLVYGVFSGAFPELSLVGHGKANNKSLTIKDQEGKYFLSMQFGREPSIAIPATAKDTFRVMIMLLEQMKANAEGLDTRDVLHIAHRVCAKHVNPQRQQQPVAA